MRVWLAAGRAGPPGGAARGARAARFDAPLVALRHGLVGTVSPAVAWEARRAARRGDRDMPPALAARVVEGWSSLDVVPPDLAEMRVLAGRAP